MHKFNPSHRKIRMRGFTVTELLIVIVVLSFLATIATVSYKGMIARANTTHIADSVSIYLDALVLYHAKHGKYPDGNADFKTCLGTGYPAGKCWKGEINENAAFMQSLKTVYGNGLPIKANESLTLRGAWFKAAGSGLTNTLDGVPADFVVYSVEGTTTKCPIGPLASDAGDSNIFTYSSTPPASGQTHPKDLTPGEPIQCWVPLSLIK